MLGYPFEPMARGWDVRLDSGIGCKGNHCSSASCCETLGPCWASSGDFHKGSKRVHRLLRQDLLMRLKRDATPPITARCCCCGRLHYSCGQVGANRARVKKSKKA